MALGFVKSTTVMCYLLYWADASESALSSSDSGDALAMLQTKHIATSRSSKLSGQGQAKTWTFVDNTYISADCKIKKTDGQFAGMTGKVSDLKTECVKQYPDCAGLTGGRHPGEQVTDDTDDIFMYFMNCNEQRGQNDGWVSFALS
eukprot:TRINITY_DN77065_c0_g1_i1.p1 TRINITY_DN77065_c0_g1~~TRINITY_DN77065_c0_g1_i1.p1  ORF type:complete len:146 (-),score=26.95 TRINITY_DN77065_c0_g1_i1:155-592(-)